MTTVCLVVDRSAVGRAFDINGHAVHKLGVWDSMRERSGLGIFVDDQGGRTFAESCRNDPDEVFVIDPVRPLSRALRRIVLDRPPDTVAALARAYAERHGIELVDVDTVLASMAMATDGHGAG